MPPSPPTDIDPAFAERVRRTYVRPLAEGEAAGRAAVLAAAARAQRDLDSLAPAPARRPIWRPRRGLARVALVAVAIALLPVAAAVAGGRLPDPIAAPYRALGIELPHQRSDSPANGGGASRRSAPAAPSTTRASGTASMSGGPTVRPHEAKPSRKGGVRHPKRRTARRRGGATKSARPQRGARSAPPRSTPRRGVRPHPAPGAGRRHAVPPTRPSHPVTPPPRVRRPAHRSHPPAPSSPGRRSAPRPARPGHAATPRPARPSAASAAPGPPATAPGAAARGSKPPPAGGRGANSPG
jgi:hypothetical protein